MRDIDVKAPALRLNESCDAKSADSRTSQENARESSTAAGENPADNDSYVPFRTRGALAIDATNMLLNQRKASQDAKNQN